MIVSTRRRPTNYTKLSNRCQECGHRLTQHNETRCLIVMNKTTLRNAETDIPCGCKAE